MIRKVGLFFIGVLFFFVGLGMGVSALKELANSVAIEQDGVTTTGRVVWTSQMGGDLGQSTKVEYSDGGGQHFIVMMFCFPFGCFQFVDYVGMTGPVAYPRTNPARAMADTFSGRWLSPVLILFIGALLALFGIVVIAASAAVVE